MKPELPIIHHLHRTGGTLISKCLASLPGTALLSEVNPGTTAHQMALDPAFQASFWLRLINEESAREMGAWTFAEKIVAIFRLAAERGEILLLRDWAYLDFFGLPFTESATHKLSTAEVLKNSFNLRQVVTVRHPMDQWLSWCHFEGRARALDFGFGQFVDGCWAFKEQTDELPWFRYEDFVDQAENTMEHLCRHLNLAYDPVFLKRWPLYRQITGDDQGRPPGGYQISKRPRRTPEKTLLAEALANEKYGQLLDAYGYS